MTSLDLYRKLYMIRRSEQKIIELYAENDMKTPMHMSMGQEAIAVAVCEALMGRGQILASYRSHAAYLAQTEDLEKFFAELYGKVDGTAKGKAGSMHLSDPDKGHFCSSAVVASCLPVAVGAAFANKARKTGKIACVFFGDGAVEEGVFWESLNAASVMVLPVLFVCEDNGLAVHTGKSARRGFSSLAGVAREFRCSVFEEKTGDVKKLYALAKEAVRQIDETGRPALLDAQCYRYLEHVGVADDFAAGYRARDEYESWRKMDALAIQRQRLIASGAERDLRTVENEIDTRIEKSAEAAKASPYPERSEIFKGVFFEKN